MKYRVILVAGCASTVLEQTKAKLQNPKTNDDKVVKSN